MSQGSPDELGGQCEPAGGSVPQEPAAPAIPPNAKPSVSPPATRQSLRLSPVRLGIIFELGLGVLALALALLFGKLSQLNVRLDWLGVLAGIAATLPLLAALAGLLSLDWRFVGELRRLVDEVILPWFVNARWWELAILCTAAGVGEELLFRGLLQPIICGAVGVATGVVLVNALFGLMHPLSLTYVVLASVIGIYLSVLLLVTDNLLVPIVVHGVYDFVALVWMLRARRFKNS
jgi:membrane protease YdiL (CAAX protease family)